MIEHHSYYDHNSTDFVVSDSCTATDDYNKLLADVIMDGSYAEITHLYAIGEAFACPIQSYIGN